MADDKSTNKMDAWALITIVILILCIFGSFWATNTATQTRFDVLEKELRNLNDATYRATRAVHRDVLHNRAMIRDVCKPISEPVMERLQPADPGEPPEPP